MTQAFGLHWFRRDLRIAGNENLRHNWKICNGRVLGVFCFDAEFLKRQDFSHNRFAFFLKTLAQLKKEMQLQGGDLLVVDAPPERAFTQLLNYLKKHADGLPKVITYGVDYEPFARSRDAKLSGLFGSYGVEVFSARDHVLIEPHEILKPDKSFYQVYTPYSRRWFEKMADPEVQRRVKNQENSKKYYERLKTGRLEKIFSLTWERYKNLPFTDQLAVFEKQNSKAVTIAIPDAGFAVAYERLLEFKDNLGLYEKQRDFPSMDGTSQLSIYQKNGSLVSSQIIEGLSLSRKSNQFVKEIAWREFYYSIMYHRPDCEKQSFLPQYQNLKWQNNEDWFARWCEGRTGFPIVDAGMRQLNTTGWMHNRVRMIVASFLVKDLLMDWRRGENYFMKMLLDGDLAPNNGGWQWAASTGCDPQPYFRIFNPWLQAAKFDPDAVYIKKYVPELAGLTSQEIHKPEGERRGYARPIVQHSEQKMKALALFQSAKSVSAGKGI